jgi:hypothetical protein
VAIRRFVRTIASQPAGFGDRHNLIAPTVSKASTPEVVNERQMKGQG